MFLNYFMSQLLLFLRSSLKENSPVKNIKSLQTNIQNDILAGIVVAIIALPLALAFGEISQLGPEAGLWSAVVGGLVGGLLGGCMVGVSGPTAPMAAQIASLMGFFVVGTTAEPDIVAAFSIIFLSGLILVLISFLKISRFIHYTPYPVIAGFMCGIGVIVVATQINAFVGLEPEKTIHAVFQNFLATIQNINPEALFVSIPSLIILFSWPIIERRIDFLKNIPGPLVALIAGTGVAYFMGLDIPFIGDKMNRVQESKIFSFYFPDFSRLNQFIGPAFILAALAIIDSLLSCKVADNLTGTQHSSDRETFGQGMANMVAGLVGGISTATATTQTVGNVKFGAKTPLATIVKGLTLLAVLFGLSSLIAKIPSACLAAILFKIGFEILDYRIIPILKDLSFRDLFVFFVVVVVTIFSDLIMAIAIGTLLAAILAVKDIRLSLRSKNKRVVLRPSESLFLGEFDDALNLDEAACVLQPQGSLFFGSVYQASNAYSDACKHKLLIVDLSKIKSIDLSGAFLIEDIVKKNQSKEIKTIVSGASPSIKERLEKINFFKNIGLHNFKDSKEFISQFMLNHRKV